jgi:hypothetical protein
MMLAQTARQFLVHSEVEALAFIIVSACSAIALRRTASAASKGGRTERTQRAVTTDTGGLAGDSGFVSGLLRAHRAIEVSDLVEFGELLAASQGAKSESASKWDPRPYLDQPFNSARHLSERRGPARRRMGPQQTDVSICNNSSLPAP